MTHIMVDLETWGLRPGSAIRSIGACAFDPVTGEIGATFYRNITDDSCEAVGLTRDPSTVAWWSDPDRAEAQADLLVDQVPLSLALGALNVFFVESEGEEMWSYGPNAEEVWLQAAYRACGMSVPWHYRGVRCARTVVALAVVDPDEFRVGTHHNALDDAKAQVGMVAAAYKRLGLTPRPRVPRFMASALVGRGAPRAA
jgi:exodeoxyribonuclease VIII